jgi:hypothetical protein
MNSILLVVVGCVWITDLSEAQMMMMGGMASFACPSAAANETCMASDTYIASTAQQERNLESLCKAMPYMPGCRQVHDKIMHDL